MQLVYAKDVLSECENRLTRDPKHCSADIIIGKMVDIY